MAVNNLSYSKYLDYKTCPLRWKWKHADRRAETDLDRPHNKILGIVWNDMLEVLYRDKKYLLGPECSKWMLEKIGSSFQYRVQDLGIVWETPEQESKFLEEAKEIVPKILECLRLEKLLGEVVEVEKALYVSLPSGNRIGGRLDLRIKRGDIYRVIDFKGTKYPKSVDPRQLFWYGLLHQGEHGKFPDFLGFWLLRSKCVEWVTPTRAGVKDFVEDIESVFRDIRAEKFDPTPSSKACKYCPYRSGCDAWTKHQADHRRPSKITDEPDGLSEVLYLD